MKNIPLLALLSLTLAACSQGASTPATGFQGIVPTDASHVIYPNTQAAIDAMVSAQANALSTQGIAPQVYLNALPIPSSTDSVRAYVKTTYASPVTTQIDWGDGSALTDLATPTTARIDTRDHAYAIFGSYTITLTSKDGSGAVIDTKSVTLMAGKKAASGVVITFEKPVAPSGYYNLYDTYQEAGFTFNNPGNSLLQFSNNYGTSYGYNTGTSQSLYTYTIRDALSLTSSDGTPFTLTSLETGYFNRDRINDYVITGHKANGTTVSVTTHEIPNALEVITFDNTWTHLTSVTFGNATYPVLDNIHAIHELP